LIQIWQKGVISSLFPDNLPTSQVWFNFRSVKSYTSRRSKSAHTFLIEPRDPKLYPLKFKCVTLEEKEKWLDAISEQLSLTSKIWSHNILTISSTSNNNKSSPTKHVFENKSVISVSVLDKWLDRLQMTEQQQRLKDAAQPNSSSGIHFLHSSR
jgi:hypothetical protein